MAEATDGPDLEVISTEALGFLAIAGEAKVRLTSSWADATPPKHAALLSIASRRGLVASAGPDAIVVAHTQTVRKAFEAPQEGDSHVKGFEPELRLPMPMRVSVLSFTADESLLLLSAESGGGLAVYDVAGLLQGSTQSTFELGTNGESLRALAPNPTPEKAELCAVLTEGGNLHMANLRDRRLGPLLRAQVSSISWSTRGKQLVAGLADGTIAQITPEGETKAMIPRPPKVVGDYHVSSLTWLENNVFLAIYTSTNEQPSPSEYFVITRTPPASFAYQKLGDPVDPFGSEKPVHHSLLRLKDYAPNITDLLVVTSTASQDVGLLSRAKQPLDADKPAELITNLFTLTELADDTKRATIPMTDSMDDSIPVGVALDLSSKETVYKPIPPHEMEESPGPLPGFWLLTHEGLLCAWWVIYVDAIKQGVTYQEMAAVEGLAGPVPATPALGSSPAQPPAAAPPPALNFGAPASVSTFGSSAAPAFGGPSALGSRASPWGSGSNTGTGTGVLGAGASATPVFGQPSQPMFGQAAGLGVKPSPWATGGTTGASPFGQSTSMGDGSGGGQQSVFGSGGGGGGGFASFAASNPFGSLGGEKPNGGGGGAFGSGASLAMDADTSFPPPKPDAQPANGFSGFKLESSFKPDPNAGEDEPAPLVGGGGGGSFFGSTFGSALGSMARPAVQAPEPKEAEMGGAEEVAAPSTTQTGPKFGLSTGIQGGGLFGSTTSAAAPAPSAGGIFGSKPAEATSGLFGSKPAASSTGLFGRVSSTQDSVPGAGLFGQKPASPQVAPQPADAELAPAVEAPAPTSAPSDGLKTVEEDAVDALPPDFLETKTIKVEDAPMPPDFLKPAPKEETAAVPAPPADASLPDEDDGFSEGSGVDVATELSPSTSFVKEVEVPKLVPQTSVGGLGGSFATARPAGGQASLFGEVGCGKASVLSQPPTASAVVPSLGRSLPSGAPNGAPGIASQILGRKSPLPQQQLQQQQQQQQPPQQQQYQQPQQPLGSSIIGGQKRAGPDPFAQSHRQSHAIREAEERQPLVDEQDAAHDLLVSDLVPTLNLDEFVAHTDVVPPANESIASQVEAVYRDINSMIDTLGINARSLACFIKGHIDLGKESGRDVDDLETADGWVMDDVKDLTSIIERDLATDLNEGRVKNLDDKIAACKDLNRDLGRQRARRADLERVIAARMDPEQAGTARSFPLTPEQNAQQNDLRREYVRFTKLLADSEEALTLLKARIASVNGSSTGGGRFGTPGTPGGTTVPTVDAVIRTISKMTSIAEKRSGDVDVLENQMRKMRLNSAAAARIRDGTPSAATTMTTPQKRSSILSSSILSPDSSSIYTVTPRRNLRASFAGSVAAPAAAGRLSLAPGASPARRKPVSSGASAEEKAELMRRLARRRDVLRRLEARVVKEGVKTWAMAEST